MAKQQLVSSGYLIGKVHRDFRPPVKGWHADAHEWIGEALGIMNCVVGMVTTQCKAVVKNYRVKIPCPVETLHGVVFENCKLTLINGSIMVDRVAQILEHAKQHPIHHYQVNPGFIHFSFEEGEVELFYDSFPTDQNGLPMIPKDFKVFEALSWYIMKQLCMRGMKHPVINYDRALERWETLYPRAQNSMKQMTVAQREAFSRNWISSIPYLHRGEDFYAETYNIKDKLENSDINEFLGTTIQ